MFWELDILNNCFFFFVVLFGVIFFGDKLKYLVLCKGVCGLLFFLIFIIFGFVSIGSLSLVCIVLFFMCFVFFDFGNFCFKVIFDKVSFFFGVFNGFVVDLVNVLILVFVILWYWK